MRNISNWTVFTEVLALVVFKKGSRKVGKHVLALRENEGRLLRLGWNGCFLAAYFFPFSHGWRFAWFALQLPAAPT